MVTPRDVLAAMIKCCDLGQNLLELSSLDFEHRVVDPLADAGLDFYFDTGASKGVLIFDEFVIKVPFMARSWDSEQYARDLEAYDRGSKSAEPMIENYLAPFCQAKNFLLETENEWDYCELECAMYQQAVREGLEAYFAKECLLGEVRGYPVYVQQLVVPFEEATSSRVSRSTPEALRSTEEMCDKNDIWCFNVEWITDFILAYGEDEFKRLDKFLKKMYISDLHRGNVGYFNGYPILLDYSNYNE